MHPFIHLDIHSLLLQTDVSVRACTSCRPLGPTDHKQTEGCGRWVVGYCC